MFLCLFFVLFLLLVFLCSFVFQVLISLFSSILHLDYGVVGTSGALLLFYEHLFRNFEMRRFISIVFRRFVPVQVLLPPPLPFLSITQGYALWLASLSGGNMFSDDVMQRRQAGVPTTPSIHGGFVIALVLCCFMRTNLEMMKFYVLIQYCISVKILVTATYHGFSRCDRWKRLPAREGRNDCSKSSHKLNKQEGEH